MNGKRCDSTYYDVSFCVVSKLDSYRDCATMITDLTTNAVARAMMVGSKGREKGKCYVTNRNEGTRDSIA